MVKYQTNVSKFNYFCQSDGHSPRGANLYDVYHGGRAHQIIELDALPHGATGSDAPGMKYIAQQYTDFNIKFDAKFLGQTRTTTPNHWEAPAFIWHYVDSTHFVILFHKTTCAELSGYDGGVNPTDEIIRVEEIRDHLTAHPCNVGETHSYDITHAGDVITIKIDGATVITNTWPLSYHTGNMMFYCEDSRIRYSKIVITPM
jgi:hypothetical protein